MLSPWGHVDALGGVSLKDHVALMPCNSMTQVRFTFHGARGKLKGPRGTGGLGATKNFKGGGEGAPRAARLIPHYVCPRRAPRAREVSERLYIHHPISTGKGGYTKRGSIGRLDQGPLGGNLTVYLGSGDGGQSGGKCELGMAKEMDSFLHCRSSTHLDSIPSGGVSVQPSQPPWQEVAGHWSGCRTPYPQFWRKWACEMRGEV